MKHRIIVSRLLAWFCETARDLPWRKTLDPYGIWVSEIMLQQTQVKTVIPYWERWMRALPTLQVLAAARPQKLHKLWEGLGYYTRVRNMHRTARIIVRKYQGRFPETFEEVLELPGIGRYTAGAICSIALNQPTPILDGNVIRVLTRLEGIDGNPRERATNQALWLLAEQLVQDAVRSPPSPDHPERRASSFNQALMELGALVCTARQPRCAICPVSSDCVAFREGRIEQLPATGTRPRSTQRRFAAFVARKGDKWLVRRRPPGVVNGHLWEFPNVEVLNGKFEPKRAARLALGFRPDAVVPVVSLKHSITRYRITLDVFSVATNHERQIKGDLSRARGRWLSRDQLQQLPFTSAHRKILDRLCPD